MLNVLAVILGHSELAMNQVPSSHPIRKNLEQVCSTCLRAKDLIGQILRFCRQVEGKMSPVSMVRIIDESVNMLRSSIPATIEIQTNVSTEEDIVLADDFLKFLDDAI